MTNYVTSMPLCVSTDGTAGPYILLSTSQLDEVCQLLDQHRVYYWSDEHAISLNGKPEVSVINLGPEGDAAAVQALLDSTR